MPGSVLVIGGGVIGTSCAYYLQKSGWRVTLLDRGRHGAGCSHGNCGYISPSHILPHAGPGALFAILKTLFRKNSPVKVRPGTALANLGWFLGFARRCNTRAMLDTAVGLQTLLVSSRTLYDDLLRDEAIDCEMEAKGLLFIFQTAAAFAHYAEIDALLAQRFHTPAKRFGADALLKLEPALKPGTASGGYLYDCDAQLRPDRLMRGWRTVLEAAGATIRENCGFTGFTHSGHSATSAMTTTGEMTADAYVVAAGAWTPQLNAALGCKVPIIPGKGYSLTMSRPKLCPTYPMIFEEHRVAISPFQSGYRIGSTMEFAGYDAAMNRDRLKLLTDGAAVYLKEPLGARVEEEWFGWRPMVFDGKPVIDRSPTMGNVLIAAGHGMLGLSMATGTGKLVAEMLNEVTPHLDPAHYSVARFQ